MHHTSSMSESCGPSQQQTQINSDIQSQSSHIDPKLLYEELCEGDSLSMISNFEANEFSLIKMRQ